jgi:hypothetical protein
MGLPVRANRRQPNGALGQLGTCLGMDVEHPLLNLPSAEKELCKSYQLLSAHHYRQ